MLRDRACPATGTIPGAGRDLFAIDVERNRAMEWSSGLEAWRRLDIAACIEDPVLAVGLAIEPLVKAAIVDDAIARALIAKNNPVIAAEKASSWRRGQEEGRREGAETLRSALLQLLAARGVSLDAADRARIAGEPDLQRLERWLARAIHCAGIAEVLADA